MQQGTKKRRKTQSSYRRTSSGSRTGTKENASVLSLALKAQRELQPSDVIYAARALSRELALNLDSHWKGPASTASGPIDVVDMFSGCGGMSAGFHAVNRLLPAFRLVAALDIDPVANQTYKTNLGLEATCRSVATLVRKPTNLESVLGRERLRKPFVLIGCAPCQGFSSYRNGDGQADPRNTLFSSFTTVALKLCPDVILVENVPELLTDRYWPIVKAARRRLERNGYYVHAAIHNMAEFGVPQERFRALLIAMKRPFQPPSPLLERSNFRTVRDAISALPPVTAGEKISRDEMHYSAGHKQSTIETIRAVPKDGGSRPPEVGPQCLRRAAERNGRAVYEDVYGRLSWDKPSITITASARNPASGRFVHPEQDRGLTIREAALLQGFPRAYRFAGGLDDSFRQIGNAVPPKFSAFLAAYILGELLNAETAFDNFNKGITSPIGSSFSRLIPALKAGYRS